MSQTPEAKRKRIAAHLRDVARTLDLYKTANGCIDCGYREHPAALHFDHVDPMTKRTDLGWKVDRSKLTSRARFERYLQHVEAYCQVRCANCHAVRTVREKQWLVNRDKGSTGHDLGAVALF